MKIQEIRGKTENELEYEIGAMKKELFDLRFKSATQGVPNPARIRELRRSIARALTLIHERATGVRGQQPR